MQTLIVFSNVLLFFEISRNLPTLQIVQSQICNWIMLLSQSAYLKLVQKRKKIMYVRVLPFLLLHTCQIFSVKRMNFRLRWAIHKTAFPPIHHSISLSVYLSICLPTTLRFINVGGIMWPILNEWMNGWTSRRWKE